MTHDDLLAACLQAIDGDWEAAHAIVQRDEADPVACWLHAVLHRIEGDIPNSRYWYRRAGREFDRFDNPQAELGIIRDHILRTT